MANYNLKEYMNKPERLAPGHRMCAGCGATIGVRAVLRALKEKDQAVIGNATGCLEVSSFMYPYSAWEDSYIHNAFENAGATMAGVETAYKVLKKKGKIPEDVNYKFITFGVMVVHTTSVSSHFPVQWKEDMIWYMSAMTTEHI